MVWLAVLAVIFFNRGLLLSENYKVMYFDSDAESNGTIVHIWNRSVGTVFALNALAILFLGFFPGLLMSECLKAVLSSVV